MPFSIRNFISRININSPVQGRLGGEVHRGERSGLSRGIGMIPFRGGAKTKTQPSLRSDFNTGYPLPQASLGREYPVLKNPAAGGAVFLFCGERGIRTPGPRKRTTVFKTAAFDHSAISPLQKYNFFKNESKMVERPDTEHLPAIVPDAGGIPMVKARGIL